MANLRLYRDIYCISPQGVYTMINPISIQANTYKTSTSALTENLTVINDITGRYYVDLNPILYTFSDIYFIEWIVVYIASSPIKKLFTRFKMNPVNLGGSGIDLEIVGNNNLDIEIINNGIEFEI